jgi:hypothetical protein
MSKILTLAGLAVVATTAAVSAQNRTLPAGDYWAFNPPIDQWHALGRYIRAGQHRLRAGRLRVAIFRQYPSINIAKMRGGPARKSMLASGTTIIR